MVKEYEHDGKTFKEVGHIDRSYILREVSMREMRRNISIRLLSLYTKVSITNAKVPAFVELRRVVSFV